MAVAGGMLAAFYTQSTAGASAKGITTKCLLRSAKDHSCPGPSGGPFDGGRLTDVGLRIGFGEKRFLAGVHEV